MSERKEKQKGSSSSLPNKSNEKSNVRKRSHSNTSKTSHEENQQSKTNSNTTNTNTDDSGQPKRARIELEQTGYGRGLTPEALMGATDIYDGELMFLYVMKIFERSFHFSLDFFFRLEFDGKASINLNSFRLVSSILNRLNL